MGAHLFSICWSQCAREMIPINDVFVLSIGSRLDYTTLRKICAMCHSRVSVYEEAEVPASDVIEMRNKTRSAISTRPNLDGKEGDGKAMMVKRVVGILLVKQVDWLNAYIDYNNLACSPQSEYTSNSKGTGWETTSFTHWCLASYRGLQQWWFHCTLH
jgi:hypothetical protein